jgi:hypothetical protein
VEQLVASADAAVEEIVRRGVSLFSFFFVLAVDFIIQK